MTAPTKAEPKASLTIKSRPKADGSVSWFLYIRKKGAPDKLIPVPQFARAEDRPAVEAFAKPYREALATEARRPKPETADKWVDRWVESRLGKVSTARRDGQQWCKWVSPVKVRDAGKAFGSLAMVDVNPDDVEAVRDSLNAEITRWEAAGKKRGVGLSYSTAKNVWDIVKQAFAHASTRKGEQAFRVRLQQGNPCGDIPPPKSGEGKRRQWLRPNELAKVFSCEAPEVLTEWKEAIALGTYLHLRPNELHVLRVRDFDLDVREVSITRSWDPENGRAKEPKTATGVRRVTIPPSLMPLVEKLTNGANPDALIAPIIAATTEHDRPEIFRTILKAAGVTRAELFEDTATHERVDFRSTRDTGITWRFLAGDRDVVIQREAGHRTLEQTLAYAKEVQDRSGRYGLPFQELPFAASLRPCEPAVNCEPSDLASSGDRSAFRSPIVARVGFEPTTFGL